MATHEAFTLNDISDHELILNDTQLELKNLQDEILTSGESHDDEQGTHESNENKNSNEFLDELNRIFIQKNLEYLNNLDQLGIKKNIKPDWVTITNKIKNFADLNKIDEETLGTYLPLPKDIPSSHLPYIAENLKALLANHLQRNPGWRSIRHGGFSTGYDLHNIEWSDKDTDKELKAVENIKKKKDIKKELNEIFSKGKKSQEYLNLWIQMTLPGKSAQEQQTIFENIFEKIPFYFSLQDCKSNKDSAELRKSYFNNDGAYNYILANKEYKLKEAYINYQIIKKSGLFKEDGNLNFDSQDFFANYQKVKNFISREKINLDFKITVGNEEKNLIDFISDIKEAALKLNIPEDLLCKVSANEIFTFLQNVQDQFTKIDQIGKDQKNTAGRDPRKNMGTIGTTSQGAGEAYAFITAVQILLQEHDKSNCITDIEEIYVDFLLKHQYIPKKDPTTGTTKGITGACNLDFSKGPNPKDIVRDGLFERSADEFWKRWDKLGKDLKSDIGGFYGMVGGIVASSVATVFTGNIFVAGGAFTLGNRFFNGYGQEVVNTIQKGYERVTGEKLTGGNTTQEFGKAFLRGLGWLDEQYKEKGLGNFGLELGFDYAANVATFGISKLTGGALAKMEGIKGIGGILKFGMEELVIENFLVDIPMNILQTGTKTFLGMSNGEIITGQTALGNKKETGGNAQYSAYNFEDMLKSMGEATEENFSFENLCQTFFNTVFYGGILEGGGKGITKIKQYHHSKKITDLEHISSELQAKNEEIQTFLQQHHLTNDGTHFYENGKPIQKGDQILVEFTSLIRELSDLNHQTSTLLQDIKTEVRNSEDPKTRVIFSLDLYSPYNTPLNILETKKKIVEDKLKEAKKKGDNQRVEELEKLLEEYKEAEKILKGEDGETQDETPEQASSSDQESQTISAEAGKEQINLKHGKSVQEIASYYGIEFYIVDTLLTPEGRKARGKYQDKLITLAKEIKDSTAPHELLHAVFDLVDTSTRKEILDAIKKDQNIENDTDAEERLADSFSEYFRTGDFEYQTKEKGLIDKIKDFFAKCVNFIRGIESNQEKIQKLFDDIISGKLKVEETSQGNGGVKWQREEINSETNQIQNGLEHDKGNLNKFKEIGIIIDEEVYNDPKLKLYKTTFDFNKLKELRTRGFIGNKITTRLSAIMIIQIKDLNIDFDKFSELEKFGIRIDSDIIKELNDVKINFEKLYKLKEFGIKLSRLNISKDIKRTTTIDVDFDQLTKLKDAGIIIESLDEIEKLNNLGWEINFEKLKEMQKFGLNITAYQLFAKDNNIIKKILDLEIDSIKLNKLKEEFGINISIFNIKNLNELEVNFEILKKLRKDLGLNITEYNIEEILKLNLSDKEISVCKEYGITEVKDIIFFLNNIENADRKKIHDFIRRKNDYLGKHRILEEQKFIELFGGEGFKIGGQDGKKGQIGKYGKIEINQDGLGYCYAYTGFELLKKTNGFNELIQTNLKETENGWEVRLPFCDNNGTWIKINKDEIDKKFIIEEDGEERNVSINSESEYLGFKILEIAFIKKSIIDRYHGLNNSLFGETNEALQKAYNQFKQEKDFTITGELLAEIEGGITESMIYMILPANYIIGGFSMEPLECGSSGLSLKMKELAFNQFSKGLYKIELGIHGLDNGETSLGTNTTITKSPYGKAVIVNDVKIINKRGVKFKSYFSINNEGKLSDNREKDGDNGEDTKDIFPDIVTNKDGKDVVMFFQKHAYSIERCYIDKSTGEKRVRVINPRHTGIKFDISLEQAKQIFDWQVTGINIDQMFREEEEGEK